jgi:hypothetical protein
MVIPLFSYKHLFFKDELQVAKQSEYEMLADELERSRSRVLVLEREREKLAENNGQT